MLKRCVMFISMLAGLSALASITSAQEISVPSVTTADPGYLFPNDKYQREREQQNRGQNRKPTVGAQPELDDAARAMVQASMKALVPEYNWRAKRDGEADANAWIRAEAFKLGQREADIMKRQ